MKPPKMTVSMVALTGANLAPLAGVLLLGWDAAAIVLLYWTENLTVGFYNILRMALVKVDEPAQHLRKLFMIPFFCLHFGGFCAVHGFFLLVLLKVGGEPRAVMPALRWPGPLVFLQLLVSVVGQLWRSRPAGMEWPVLCLFASHGISFVHNYRPYARIVLLHVVVIAGAAPMMMLGSPAVLLFMLVGFKIGMDIWLHARSHRPAVGESEKEDGAGR